MRTRRRPSQIRFARSVTVLHHTVERRAREGGSTVQRSPLQGARRRLPTTPSAEAPLGLTRRERRVRDVLLQELVRVNGREWGSGLSYAEKQHLEKTLSVAFIDAELAKMRHQQRIVPRVFALVGLFLVALQLPSLWAALSGPGIDWAGLLTLLPFAGFLVIPTVQTRALRRKIFIYEALRELTDANEADVVLGRVVRDADALIDRIVARELDAAVPARPHR